MSLPRLLLGGVHRRVALYFLRVLRPVLDHRSLLAVHAVRVALKARCVDEELVRSVREAAERIEGRRVALGALVSRLGAVRDESARWFSLSDFEADTLIVAANVAGVALDEGASADDCRALVDLVEQLDALPQERAFVRLGGDQAVCGRP